MTKRIDSNEIVVHRLDTGNVEVVEVSEETLRWSRRECAHGPERRSIRRPFVATIEKTPNLYGPLLRFASDAGARRDRQERRGNSR